MSLMGVHFSSVGIRTDTHMSVGLLDNTLVRTLYGKACSCHQVYTLASRGDPACCGEQDGTTHWTGTLEG